MPITRQDPNALNGPLVSAAGLLRHLETSAEPALLLDCRHDLANPLAGAEAYAAGHLPGAVFAPLDEALAGPPGGGRGRHQLPDATHLANWLAAQGLRPGRSVLAYDAHGGMFAARAWWLLRWLGHAPVAVLDGGIPAWLAAGGGLVTEATRPTPGHFRALPGQMPTVSAEHLLQRLGQATPRVIDARAPDRYRGENETLDPVGGHIPGAINRCFRDNLGADGRFKAPEVLRHEWLAILGGCDPSTVVSQCGSGVTACHNLLALELANLPGAALYPGSWSERCSDPDRPVASGALP